MRLLALLSLLIVGIASLFARPSSRCGSGGCVLITPLSAQRQAAPPMTNEMRGGSFVQAASPGYRWERVNEQQTILRKDGKIIGQWYHPNNAYYPWDGVMTGAKEKPPIDAPGSCSQCPANCSCGCKAGVPCKCSQELKPWQLHGVSVDKLAHREKVTYNGRELNAEELAQAFADSLTDDSGKGHFIVWARDQATRDKVLADWNALPSDFKDRYQVCAVPPDHFWMQDRFDNKPRFFTEGDPSVILTDPKGVVLFRRPQAGQVYQSPIDMQDLLKSDPSYNPKLDPGGPKLKIPSLAKIPPIVWVGGGLLALLIFARKPS